MELEDLCVWSCDFRNLRLWICNLLGKNLKCCEWKSQKLEVENFVAKQIFEDKISRTTPKIYGQTVAKEDVLLVRTFLCFLFDGCWLPGGKFYGINSDWHVIVSCSMDTFYEKEHVVVRKQFALSLKPFKFNCSVGRN